METKWLEDFVSLAETRSFSRSAQLRHVTQPAFSRRIQSLEAWAGVDLVDRSSFPTRLTPAGELLHAQALEILGSLQSVRHLVRSHQADNADVIEFAVPHTLAFTFFPHWLMGLQTQFGLSRGPAAPLKSRLTALNVHDAALRLAEGGCDLLIAYHHPSQPLQLSPQRYDMLVLGRETLAPFSCADGRGRAVYTLPGQRGRNIPFLNYAPGAYLARLVDLILKESPQAAGLEPVYETDMAEGLKAMAIEGHGLTFLPLGSVQKELRAGRLVEAAPEDSFRLTMEVRIYRERPTPGRPAKEPAQGLWAYLEGRKHP